MEIALPSPIYGFSVILGNHFLEILGIRKIDFLKSDRGLLRPDSYFGLPSYELERGKMRRLRMLLSSN